MRVAIELREDIANESAGDLPELSRAPLEPTRPAAPNTSSSDAPNSSPARINVPSMAIFRGYRSAGPIGE